MARSAQQLSGFLRRLLETVIVIGIPVTLATPVLLQDYYRIVFWMATKKENELFLVILLITTGVFMLVLLFEARKILITVSHNEPFQMANAHSLKRMAGAALLISGAYLIKSVCFPTFLTIVVCFMTFVFGLFALVMARVFYEAVVVKEENDLTV